MDLLGIWNGRGRKGGLTVGLCSCSRSMTSRCPGQSALHGGHSWLVLTWGSSSPLPCRVVAFALRFRRWGAVLGCRRSGDLVGLTALPFPSARRPVAPLGAFPARGRRGSGAAAVVCGGIGRWEQLGGVHPVWVALGPCVVGCAFRFRQWGPCFFVARRCAVHRLVVFVVVIVAERGDRGCGGAELAFGGGLNVGTWHPARRSAFWGGQSGLGVLTWSSSSVLSPLPWGCWHELVHLLWVVSVQVSWQGDILTGALPLSRRGHWSVGRCVYAIFAAFGVLVEVGDVAVASCWPPPLG